MRICIDVSPAVHGRAGLGRYAQELTNALLALDRENEYIAFYNRPSRARPAPPLDRLPRLTTPLPNKPWRMSVLLAQLAGLPQDHLLPGVDIFHAADHLLPHLHRVKSVFTLYDVAFRLYPETHTIWNRSFLTLMIPRFLQAADRVIAISECTKRDAVRLYGIAPEKMQVIYIGVSEHFAPAPAPAIDEVRRRYGLPANYLLYVGTMEPRKNLAVLLEAYQALRERGYAGRLVFAGKKGWLYQDFFRRLKGLGLENEVIFLGFVADGDLPALYSGAELFIYPSLYEGFGLPVLEALACGAPVVCSNAASLPEVAGEAAVLISPHDVRALTAGMEQVLMNDELRRALRAQGPERARRFTWQATARQTLEMYRSLASNERFCPT